MMGLDWVQRAFNSLRYMPLVGMALAGMALGVPAGASAAPDPTTQGVEGASPEATLTQSQAEDLYARAVRHVRRGQAEAAIDAFETVLPLMNDGSDIFYNLTQLQWSERRFDKVVIYAQGFLQFETSGEDAREIRRKLNMARVRLQKKGVPVAVVTIEPLTAGAKTVVASIPMRRSPQTLELPLGRWQVTVSKADYHPYRATIEVKDRAPISLPAKLERIVYTGTLFFEGNTTEGAVVYIDDKPVGRTPIAPLDLPLKKYLVRLEKPGFESWSRYVTINKNRKVALGPTLERVERQENQRTGRFDYYQR